MEVAEIFFLSVINPWVRWPPSGRSRPMMRPWGSTKAVYTAKLAGEPGMDRPEEVQLFLSMRHQSGPQAWTLGHQTRSSQNWPGCHYTFPEPRESPVSIPLKVRERGHSEIGYCPGEASTTGSQGRRKKMHIPRRGLAYF